MVDLYPSKNLNACNLLSVRHVVYKLLFHVHLSRFGDILGRSSCKIESTKIKQTITNNDLVVDLPTKILDENINLNRIKKQFTIDGCKCLKKKKISKTKETAEWNCSVCKIDVHLYVSIVCDECLGWNHLKYVGLKAPPKSTNWLCR